MLFLYTWLLLLDGEWSEHIPEQGATRYPPYCTKIPRCEVWVLGKLCYICTYIFVEPGSGLDIEVYFGDCIYVGSGCLASKPKVKVV